jgi:4a-hydroxytetrahydrobiopterin dehydratase
MKKCPSILVNLETGEVMNDLTKQQCQACEGGIQPMSAIEIEKLIGKIPLWQVNSEGTQIQRHFSFKSFLPTMAFVNAVAWVAHQQKHHPDLEVGYNYCTVKYSTHAIQGLSENDFICAAKVDALA